MAHEKAKSGAERRKFPRLRDTCSIRVKPIAGASMPAEGIDAMTVNISGGGLCYRSPEPVGAGDFLAVEMSLPEFSSSIVAMGRAVFCDRGAEGYEVGSSLAHTGSPKERMAATMQHFVDHLEDVPAIVIICMHRHRDAWLGGVGHGGVRPGGVGQVVCRGSKRSGKRMRPFAQRRQIGG